MVFSSFALVISADTDNSGASLSIQEKVASYYLKNNKFTFVGADVPNGQIIG